MIHGNGIHKGPAWPQHGGASNLPRTAVRLDFNGYKFRNPTFRWKGERISARDYAQLTPMQRLFTDESAVVGEK